MFIRAGYFVEIMTIVSALSLVFPPSIELKWKMATFWENLTRTRSKTAHFCTRRIMPLHLLQTETHKYSGTIIAHRIWFLKGFLSY